MRSVGRIKLQYEPQIVELRDRFQHLRQFPPVDVQRIRLVGVAEDPDIQAAKRYEDRFGRTLRAGRGDGVGPKAVQHGAADRDYFGVPFSPMVFECLAGPFSEREEIVGVSDIVVRRLGVRVEHRVASVLPRDHGNVCLATCKCDRPVVGVRDGGHDGGIDGAARQDRLCLAICRQSRRQPPGKQVLQIPLDNERYVQAFKRHQIGETLIAAQALPYRLDLTGQIDCAAVSGCGGGLERNGFANPAGLHVLGGKTMGVSRLEEEHPHRRFDVKGLARSIIDEHRRGYAAFEPAGQFSTERPGPLQTGPQTPRGPDEACRHTGRIRYHVHGDTVAAGYLADEFVP